MAGTEEAGNGVNSQIRGGESKLGLGEVAKRAGPSQVHGGLAVGLQNMAIMV